MNKYFMKGGGSGGSNLIIIIILFLVIIGGGYYYVITNTKAPITTASGTTAPGTTASGITAPVTPTPGTTTPDTTASGITAPVTTAPGTTTPGTTALIICPEGQVSGPNGSCSNCPAGTSSKNDYTGASVGMNNKCLPCNLNSTSDGNGGPCLPCPPDTASEGGKPCTKCPLGWELIPPVDIDNSPFRFCASCNANWSSDGNGGLCLRCPSGTTNVGIPGTSSSIGTPCNTCPPGYILTAPRHGLGWMNYPIEIAMDRFCTPGTTAPR